MIHRFRALLSINLGRYSQALGKAHERQVAALATQKASGTPTDARGSWGWFHSIPGLPQAVCDLAWYGGTGRNCKTRVESAYGYSARSYNIMNRLRSQRCTQPL
jgi:hypothetical protein